MPIELKNMRAYRQKNSLFFPFVCRNPAKLVQVTDTPNIDQLEYVSTLDNLQCHKLTRYSDRFHYQFIKVYISNLT